MRSIFIYGVPGSGKTHLSIPMSKELGLDLIEADTLKAGLNIPGTCQAWKQFGWLNKDNAVKGLLFVRESLRNVVRIGIKGKTGILIEGAFLDPQDFSSFASGLLVVTRDADKHHKQFFAHRQINEETQNEFVAARLNQEFLMEEAGQLAIKIHENT